MESSPERFMARALELARRGVGRVSPNPTVGAVAVRDAEIIAEGYHALFGGPHAERVLIDSVAIGTLRGADLYVTLEPCAHHGKTPPCSDAVIEAGFSSVCYATDDPNPETRGLGPEKIAARGIIVTRGVLESESRYAIAGYLKHTTTALPLVTSKWAMTADGRIASTTGDSRWISSSAMLERTRRERLDYDAIVIGRGTRAADDPLLTDRSTDVRNPTRVVLDSALEIVLDSQLVETAQQVPVIVFANETDVGNVGRADELRARGVTVEWVECDDSGRLSIDAILRRIGALSMTTVLVEGGSQIHGSFFDARQVDRVQIVVGGKIVGGGRAPGPIAGEGIPRMVDALSIEAMHVTPVGSDVLIEGALTPAGLGVI